MDIDVSEGDIFNVKYPFMRGKAEILDCAITYETKEIDSWYPGVGYRLTGPEGDSDAIADGEGFQVLSVIGIYKPGKYPTRVFYTRTWIDPDGKDFGKTGLRIISLHAFKRIARGYRYEYQVSNPIAPDTETEEVK